MDIISNLPQGKYIESAQADISNGEAIYRQQNNYPKKRKQTLFRVVFLLSDILCNAKSDMIAVGNRDIEPLRFQ